MQSSFVGAGSDPPYIAWCDGAQRCAAHYKCVVQGRAPQKAQHRRGLESYQRSAHCPGVIGRSAASARTHPYLIHAARHAGSAGRSAPTGHVPRQSGAGGFGPWASSIDHVVIRLAPGPLGPWLLALCSCRLSAALLLGQHDAIGRCRNVPGRTTPCAVPDPARRGTIDRGGAGRGGGQRIMRWGKTRALFQGPHGRKVTKHTLRVTRGPRAAIAHAAGQIGQTQRCPSSVPALP